MALSRRKVKYFTAGLLAAAVLVLVFQNSGNTRINFLFLSGSVPTLVLILGTFLVGVFVGTVMGRRR